MPLHHWSTNLLSSLMFSIVVRTSRTKHLTTKDEDIRFYSRDTWCAPLCNWYKQYGLKLRVKVKWSCDWPKGSEDLRNICEVSHRLSRALMAVSCAHAVVKKYCWNTFRGTEKMWLINPTTRPSDCCPIILLCWNIQRKGINGHLEGDLCGQTRMVCSSVLSH